MITPTLSPTGAYNPAELRKLRAEYVAAVDLLDRLIAAEDRLAGGQASTLSAGIAPRTQLRGLARVAADINRRIGAQPGSHQPASLSPMAAGYPAMVPVKPLFGLARAARAINQQFSPQMAAGRGVTLVTLTAECGRDWLAKANEAADARPRLTGLARAAAAINLQLLGR